MCWVSGKTSNIILIMVQWRHGWVLVLQHAFVCSALQNCQTRFLFSLRKPCKAIHSEDVDHMYVELLQRCKQMFLTEAETVDDHLYQLPSFLQSIASVIFHIDTVSGVFKVPPNSFMQFQVNEEVNSYEPAYGKRCFFKWNVMTSSP